MTWRPVHAMHACRDAVRQSRCVPSNAIIVVMMSPLLAGNLTCHYFTARAHLRAPRRRPTVCLVPSSAVAPPEQLPCSSKQRAVRAQLAGDGTRVAASLPPELQRELEALAVLADQPDAAVGSAAEDRRQRQPRDPASGRWRGQPGRTRLPFRPAEGTSQRRALRRGSHDAAQWPRGRQPSAPVAETNVATAAAQAASRQSQPRSRGRQQPQPQLQPQRQCSPQETTPSSSRKSANTGRGPRFKSRFSHKEEWEDADPLKRAVRTGKRSDWQATRDWLLMEMGDAANVDDQTFADIAEAADLPDRCRPQVAYLHNLGMSKRDLVKLRDTREQLFYLSLPTIRSKLMFLQDVVGLRPADLCKLLMKFPRIIEYRTERTLRPRLDFFLRHGVQQEDLARVVARAPMTLELNVEYTLEPRVHFLRESVGIGQDSIAKVLVKVPSLLSCTEERMQERVDFLLTNCFNEEQLAKAAVAHPQILYYRTESMAEKVQYLRSIGISKDSMPGVLTRLPQLLSLDIKGNMVPKYNYLQQQLGGNSATVSGYPAYFSLSLMQRIMPRHRFLQTRGKEPEGAFPMSHLYCTDEKYAETIACTPLEQFNQFRNELSRRMSGSIQQGAMRCM